MNKHDDRLYLEYVKIHRFGKYSDRLVGPFKPGLNIVYGPNESGKSTTASCVGGVLYGWERAAAQKNSYRPQEGRRAASLFYREGSKRYEFKRVRNNDGIQDVSEVPYVAAHPQCTSIEGVLTGDIDKKTFSSLFSLTSDELLRLENTSDMTATLLTAGSGTDVSPVAALRAIDARIADLCSRKASVSRSFKNLDAGLMDCQDELRDLRQTADSLRSQEVELRELTQEIELKTQQRQDAQTHMDEDVALQAHYQANADSLDEKLHQAQELKDALDELDTEEQVALRNAQGCLNLTEQREALLREELDAHRARHGQLETLVIHAQEAFDQAAAHYQTLTGTQVVKPHAPAPSPHKRLAVAGTVLAIAFLLLSVGALVVGDALASPVVFGVAAVGIVAALIIGVVLLVLGFKTTAQRNPVAPTLETAQFAMNEKQELLLRAKKNLEAHNAEVTEWLAGAELSSCAGSVTQAYTLLDQAHQVRETLQDIKHRHQTFHVQHEHTHARIEELEAMQQALINEHDLDEVDPLGCIAQRIQHARYEVNQAQDSLEHLHRRRGEIEQSLRSGVESHELDKLKIHREELITQRKESLDEFTRLVLARQMLEASIASWQNTSQPEVYAEASRLLSLMTNGAWQSLYMDNDGQLRVVDAALTQQPVYHLSLGTCQQLYLALRIALLMHTESVGRAIPVLADDILVNFDKERQRSALIALSELSKKRQVIVFTCHREVRQLAKALGCKETLNVIAL